MKQILLTCFTFLIAGQFCFAGNIQNLKTEIFGNKENQEIFSEFKNSLAASYQTETTQEVTVGNVMQNQEDGFSILFNKYPEFIGTQLESTLVETFKKNPNLVIKSISYDMEDYSVYSYSLPSVFNIVFSNGKKLSLEVIHKDYYRDLASLWAKNLQRIEQYRNLIKMHRNARTMVRKYVKEQAGADYNEYIPFKCKHTVSKVNISGEKKIQCMPVGINLEKDTYTQMGAVRFYPIHTNSSWLYLVNNVPWLNNISKTSPHSFNPYKQSPYREKHGDASSVANTGWFFYKATIGAVPLSEVRNNWFGRNILPHGGFLGLTTDYDAITYQNDPGVWDWSTKLKTKETTYGFREESNGLVWKSSYWFSDLKKQGEIFFLNNDKLIPYINAGDTAKNYDSIGYYCRTAVFNEDLEEVKKVYLQSFASTALYNGERCEIVAKNLPKTFMQHLNSIK